MPHTEPEIRAMYRQAFRDGPQPGDIRRHFRGGLYFVVACSFEEGTLEPLVTYRSDETAACWTRTLANFTEAVEVTHGVFVPRFKRLTH